MGKSESKPEVTESRSRPVWRRIDPESILNQTESTINHIVDKYGAGQPKSQY
jgi:hypothetical protein